MPPVEDASLGIKAFSSVPILFGWFRDVFRPCLGFYPDSGYCTTSNDNNVIVVRAKKDFAAMYSSCRLLHVPDTAMHHVAIVLRSFGFESAALLCCVTIRLRMVTLSVDGRLIATVS